MTLKLFCNVMVYCDQSKLCNSHNVFPWAVSKYRNIANIISLPYNLSALKATIYIYWNHEFFSYDILLLDNNTITEIVMLLQCVGNLCIDSWFLLLTEDMIRFCFCVQCVPIMVPSTYVQHTLIAHLGSLEKRT